MNLKKQSGSALTMALFIIFAISIFAMASSSIVGNDLVATMRFKNNIQAGFLARAGFEQAAKVLKEDNSSFDCLNDHWRGNDRDFKDVKLSGGVFTVAYNNSGDEVYGVVDEESKVNINTASEQMLAGLTGIDRETAKEIVSARKRAIFHSPTDLVARGIIGDAVFNGSRLFKEQKRLKDLVTVWGDGRININTASREVLVATPELKTIEVDAILAFRIGKDGIQGTSDDGIFKNANDFDKVTGVQFEDFQKFFTVTSSNFCIVSTGTAGSGHNAARGKKVIEAVVERKHNKILVKYWGLI